MMHRRLLPLCVSLAFVALLVFGIDDAMARPGGGHSYSGGSSGSGGGDGGDGGGALLYLLMRLIFEMPQVGIPLAIVVGVVVFKAKTNNSSLSDWESGESIASYEQTIDLGSIRSIDPNFSHVRFNDFAYALYADAHIRRHNGEALAKLAPYLDSTVRESLAMRPPRGGHVEAVTIGSMRIRHLVLGQGDANTCISVDFESNLITNTGGSRHTHFTQETWTFIRSANVQSRPPGSPQVFNCPNCMAPFESTDDATCGYCGEVVAAGRFDWSVSTVTLSVDEERLPTLSGHAHERGSRLETVFHPMVNKNFTELHAADPTVSYESIGSRTHTIFTELNRGWSANDLSIARPFISDGMANYLGYWLGAYQQQGLRNITDNTVIERWEVARVSRDNHYDAIVVRIFAHSLDYTLNSGGKVVGGSKSSPREYTEYWTLIRAAGVKRSPLDPSACPNCGAPLKITMGGNCGFCQAHVTNGEFDWVLSKIEQDEAYVG